MLLHVVLTCIILHKSSAKGQNLRCDPVELFWPADALISECGASTGGIYRHVWYLLTTFRALARCLFHVALRCPVSRGGREGWCRARQAMRRGETEEVSCIHALWGRAVCVCALCNSFRVTGLLSNHQSAAASVLVSRYDVSLLGLDPTEQQGHRLCGGGPASRARACASVCVRLCVRVSS